MTKISWGIRMGFGQLCSVSQTEDDRQEVVKSSAQPAQGLVNGE